MSTEAPMTAAEIREMSEEIRSLADQYAHLASKMDELNIESIAESGRATFQDVVLFHMRRNVRRLAARVDDAEQTARRAAKQQKIADPKEQYVAETKTTKQPPKAKTRSKRPPA